MSGPLFVEIHVYAKIGKKEQSKKFLYLKNFYQKQILH